MCKLHLNFFPSFLLIWNKLYGLPQKGYVPIGICARGRSLRADPIQIKIPSECWQLFSPAVWKADSICSWQLPREQQSDWPGTHPSAFISPDPDNRGARGKAREDQPNTKLDWRGLSSEWACSNVQIHIPSSKTKRTFTGHVSSTHLTVGFLQFFLFPSENPSSCVTN